MNIIAFILVIVAISFAVFANFQSKWRSPVAWAAIALGVALLIQFCTTWTHTIHF